MRTRLISAAAVTIVALGSAIAVGTGAGADAPASGTHVAAAPTGPGCADIPAEGEGSLAAMASEPAGTALAGSPELSTLAAAVEAAGLTEVANGTGPYTFFAPSNAAFDKIPTNVLDSILADTDMLTSILTFHVIQGQALTAADLAAAGEETSVEGSPLTFALDGDTLMVNGSAAVVCADIPVANGIVHIIDSVLQPPSLGGAVDGSSSSIASSVPIVTAAPVPPDGPQGPACASIPAEGEGSFAAMASQPAATAAASNPDLLSSFVDAVEAAGLTDTLNGAGPFTIFAPSNEAIAKIPQADLDAILGNVEQLASILNFHVIDGQSLTAADLAAAGEETTVNGAPLEFSVSPDGSLVINGTGATVSCSNITVANGIIHIIDSLLVPPAG